RLPERDDLGWRALRRLDPAARHLDHPDRRERSAGTAIEHIEITLLRRQHQSGRAIIVDQRRLAAEVVIPHILLHCLEMPTWLSGGHVECDERGGERVFLRASL